MTATLDELRARAEAWLADDPEPDTRDELRTVLDRLPDPDAAADLADRFARPLTFGTAGLRGPLRAGPNGMNRAVVRAAAAGLVSWLAARGAQGPLVIGYDARRGSREFAMETSRVATGAGRAALLLPRALPTPVLAYAVGATGAAAGVMVTASHNPREDNGYKVYLGARLGGRLGAGAQIVPPADTEIEEAIRAVRLRAVPLGDPGEVLDEHIVASYVSHAAAVVDPAGPKDLSIAYTPLHGVGGPLFADALTRAGFTAPAVVAEQAEPDPDFPTVPFPNPEEPGAMDRLFALAQTAGADVAIANDPDADRAAVGIRSGDGWRALRGDEVGVLLADHMMRQRMTGTYATTVVSSSLLRAMCAARAVPYAETLTGFKWIVRAAEDLVYGYEEALGYCVAPDVVRDKDGISAALLVCELAAGLKAEGRTLADRLDDIAAEFGVYHTEQISVRVDDRGEIAAAMARIRQEPPRRLLDDPVTEVEDRLPEADVLILRTDRARVVVRPSGTEAKLKAYLEVVEPVTDGDLAGARDRAAAAAGVLRTEISAVLGIG